MICATKLRSNSSVLTTVTACVDNTSKICGSLRATKSPSLLGGPGGKGVATGVGVGGGRGVSVGLGGVGVRVGSGAKAGPAPSGLLTYGK